MIWTKIKCGLLRRVFPAFSKVGESVFFVLGKSNGESFAFLEKCVDSFSFFNLGISIVEPGRMLLLFF